MKLAIITERANITLGGAERSVFELAGRMAILGVEVKILAATGTSKSQRVNVLCSSSKKRVSLKTFEKALRRHLEENHYDIVHSTLPFDFADVYQPRGGSYPEAIIRNAASYPNTLMRIYKLASSFANFKRTSLSRAEKKLCKKQNTPVIAALSEYVKQQFKKHYGLDNERVFVIPNGIRLTKPSDKLKLDKLYAQILIRLGIKQAAEPVFFLFAAHNFRLKGLNSLIKALAVVKKKYTKRPAYLVIAGRGRVLNFRHLAGKYKVKDRIIFLGPYGSVRNLLEVCDVAVLPTYYDPSSRFVLESLAADRGVITTKYNGAVDLFEPGRHGRVFHSPDDIDSLAEAIRFYCNTDNLAAVKEAIEADGIKSKVSIEAHCRKLLELYEKIIKNRTQGTEN